MKPYAIAILAIPCFSFGQLSLRNAERAAEDSNPMLKAARAGVEAAKAAAGKLLAPFNPMADLRLYGGRRDGTVMNMGFGFEMLEGSGGGGNAMLTWKVFSGGQDRTARAIASSEIAIAESRAGAARLDVLLEVRTEFAEASRMREELQAAEATLESAKELERVTRERFEAGKLPEAFVFGAKADRLKAERIALQVEAERKGAEARLAAAVGVAEIEGGIGEWDGSLDLPEDFDQALRAAFAESPVIAELQREARAWSQRARFMRQSGLPHVSLVAIGDRIFSGAAMGDSGSQVGLSLTFPVVDGGMRSSEASEAEKKSAEFAALADHSRNRVRAELAAAWAQWAAAPKAIEAAKSQVDSAHEGYRVAKLRYEEGKAIRAEVAQALADLQEARSGLAEAHKYQRVAWARVKRAMGE